MKKSLFFFFPLILSLLWLSSIQALTLEQALKMAQKYYPPLKAQQLIEKKERYFYKATIDPYLPTLSSGISYQRTFTSSLYSPGRIWDNQYTWDLTLKYRLFDGGYRYSQRKQALFTLKQAKTDIETIINNLCFEVKRAFYTALAKEMILKTCQETEAIAKKNYDLALARRQVGIAMRSDVTQAQVRYINARMDTVSAQKDLEKAIAALNSLIGWPLNKRVYLAGKLKTNWLNVSLPFLQKEALAHRPEVKKQELELKKLQMSIKTYKSEYYPKLDLQVGYTRYDQKPDFSEEEAIGMVSLSYIFFNGPGRYYHVSGQKRALKAAKAQLEEVKRQVRLEVYQAYKDLEVAFSKLKIAQQLVKKAKVNYQQAYGEYKVGKGDIISLIEAEINLSESKLSLINQMLNYNLAISALEKAVFVNSLWEK